MCVCESDIEPESLQFACSAFETCSRTPSSSFSLAPKRHRWPRYIFLTRVDFFEGRIWVDVQMFSNSSVQIIAIYKCAAVFFYETESDKKKPQQKDHHTTHRLKSA